MSEDTEFTDVCPVCGWDYVKNVGKKEIESIVRSLPLDNKQQGGDGVNSSHQ